ncbi:MAG: methionyl-tRNA formyltransferase, partial [Candidatus Binatia bacterium]
FWTDAGIDTGPILVQKEVPIGPDDTTGSFYYDRIFLLGVDAIEEAVDQVERGTAPKIPQDESQATYDPLCRDEHVAIDWLRPAREVYDLVRGADPQPGSWAVRQDERVRFYDCRLDAAERGEPGEVLGIDERGAAVALRGGTLVVGRMRHGASPKKVAPQELEAEGKLAAGDRLEGVKA